MAYITAQELQEANADAKTLDRFSNDSVGVPNINRVGNDVENLMTLRQRMLDAASDVANRQVYLTEGEMLADTSQPINTPARVETGSGAGDYIMTESGWVWSDIQPASNVIVAALDSLVVNRGKRYPLRAATRAGISSVEMVPFSNLLLDARVNGAEPGKLYGIKYQKNNSAAGGSYAYGWTLTEHDAADYETTDAGMLLLHNYTQAAPDIDRAGGIQTIVIRCQNKQTVTFAITVDASQLPPEGSSIDANSSDARPGWSWIVDPSCYVRAQPSAEDSLTINSGKAYPLRVANRGGISSLANGSMNGLLLDVNIDGGDLSKVYRVAYQQNGASLGGTNTYDWIVEEYDAATYETAPSRVIIMSYNDDQYGPQPQIDRNGGIQTVHLFPPSRDGMRIDITCDASKLPPEGTPVNAYTGTGEVAGWSWIVDPSRIRPPAASNTPAQPWNKSGILWSYSAERGGTFVAVTRSGEWMYRHEIGPKGTNLLPDIRSVKRAPLGNPDSATWVPLQQTDAGGDWCGPYQVAAANDGDGDTSRDYTGGNHGKDGNIGGGASALNRSFVIFVDGMPTQAGSQGVAEAVQILAANDVMGFNTRTLDRYVLREYCVFTCVPGGVLLEKAVQALEDVLVYQDNALQSFTEGFQSGSLIYYGKVNSRIPFSSSTSSGAKSSYPDVWAVVFHDAENGQFAAWMDRSYGIGDASQVKGSAALIRGSGTATNKFYHAAIVSDDGMPLSAGESYRWRGGWAWQQATAVSPDLDSVLAKHIEGRIVIAAAALDGSTVEV